jgi:ABC-type antimicrobial peptide transport system permease subunit
MMNDADPEKVRRVTEAMLRMTKLDIAALEKASVGVALPWHEQGAGVPNAHSADEVHGEG